ncbi:metallophosphoesterase [Amycolatopsis thermophila]|uniref:3',5'-cyclic AMP phosphodiesterase CpdA n=1 Tax=Amycolatopsis thermophila TaxID=206084 RepID=A0ABU0F081_9PSEU|nr:metallophosphoesterase [Amycolatopsis thermophila]MDQ0380601.1 3',5'-cyclic AMP phosphodiesterase CpdA [Amycolatopsis thermophila]
MLLLAHLSDIHLDGGERNAGRAARIVRYLADLPRPVDAVLVTGDLADHGSPQEYGEVATLLAGLPYPVFHCPGNHDARPAYREALLGEAPSDAPVNQARHAGGAVFALCDSSIPGSGAGHLADETLDWLDGVLAEEAGRPAFVAFHHPPVVLHHPLLDEIRQRQAERLAEVVGRHPDVVALFCGHAHTPSVSTFAGRPLVVAPGVVSTLSLPWEPGGEVGWADGGPLDHDRPPALAFHVVDDDRRLTTHFRLCP